MADNCNKVGTNSPEFAGFRSNIKTSVAYNFFANNDICMVWSQLAELQTPPILTTDFLYLRFIGDRSIHEKDFGRIQINRVLEMEKWAENIKTVQNERIKLAIIAANNLYAGL